MSKKNKQRKLDKQLKHEENKYRELIEDLLYGLDEYGVQFEIVNNDMIKEFKDSDSQFLKSPLAVKYIIPSSEWHTGSLFSNLMYLNEAGNGFIIWREDISIDVDGPSWFFVGYSDFLERRIRELKGS